jgi:DNA replication and repair protein RecF
MTIAQTSSLAFTASHVLPPDSVFRQIRPAPAVTRLVVTDFRSYGRAAVEVDARPVVLTGPNGAGKTNLLEALSFLSPGRGLRRARLTDVIRRGAAGGWAVAATVGRPEGPVQVGTGLVVDGAAPSERRTVRIDGTQGGGQSELPGILGLAWLTPQMDRLFIEAASGRRRFLDRLVFGLDPEHARVASAYERAMRERGRLLRDGPRDPAWLAALEDTMAAQGVALAAARRDFVARLGAALDMGVGPFPKAGLALDGTLEGWLAEMPALEVEDRFRAALAEARGRDGEAGGATIGPHRSDLAVTHLAKDMPAGQCSTGEQKALLIAMVVANARLAASQAGAPPVLLLDEVAAHLDEGRRRALFDEVLALGVQAWLTGTDAALFEGLVGQAQFFTVADGTITPSGPAKGWRS